MNLGELKQRIEQQAGVPAVLLTGETAEENIAQAKALLAYKREYEQQRPKTTAEQFADWIGGELEERDRQQAATFGLQYTPRQEDAAGAALAQIEEQARLDAGGYPMLQDGGSVNVNIGDGRTAREQFAEWLGQRTAFDPFKEADGWKHLV